MISRSAWRTLHAMLGTQGMQRRHARKRIFIADDSPLARRGLKALIDAEPDLIVCGEAANREDALRAIAAAPPDLAVVDPSLDRGGGFDLIGEIRSRHEGMPVLALSAQEAPSYIRRAFAAGATGYVAKSAATDTLLAAIRGVLRGETFGAAD
jgi:DNA-binding NarL/FixJ family response regulator